MHYMGMMMDTEIPIFFSIVWVSLGWTGFVFYSEGSSSRRVGDHKYLYSSLILL